MCRQLRCLPREGGLLDQRPRELALLDAVFDAFEEIERIEREKSKRKSRSK